MALHVNNLSDGGASCDPRHSATLLKWPASASYHPLLSLENKRMMDMPCKDDVSFISKRIEKKETPEAKFVYIV